VRCVRYWHSDISSPKKNKRIIKPLIAVPTMAQKRFAFLTHATMLTISATGGVRRPSSRMQQQNRGQSCWRDQRQIQANPSGVHPVGNNFTSIVLLFEHLRGFQFDSNRLADGFHRRQIELDLDRDSFAKQFLGHSP